MSARETKELGTRYKEDVEIKVRRRYDSVNFTAVCNRNQECSANYVLLEFSQSSISLTPPAEFHTRHTSEK